MGTMLFRQSWFDYPAQKHLQFLGIAPNSVSTDLEIQNFFKDFKDS